jgi:hypothetical protein
VYLTTHTCDTENNLLGITDAAATLQISTKQHAVRRISRQEKIGICAEIVRKKSSEEIWLPGEDSNFQPFG